MTAMPSSPVVSVVIPTYNRPHLLGRALRSVLAQTFQDFEIIVVDDASTDNHEEVVRAFGDARIQYLRHPTNRGQSAAENTGIRAATGQYVAFLDDDDEWLPEKLALQLEVFKTSKLEHLGVVTCLSFHAYEGKKEMIPQVASSRRQFASGWVYKDVLARRPGVKHSTITLLIRRDALTEANLFDESLPRSKDWDLVLRLSRDWQFESVEVPLAIYHHHFGPSIRHSASFSVSADKRGVVAEERIISKYYTELAAEPGALARHYSRLAWLCFRSGDKAKCRKSVSNALRHRHNRRYLRLRLLYGLTFLPGNVLHGTRRGMARMKQRLGRRTR